MYLFVNSSVLKFHKIVWDGHGWARTTLTPVGQKTDGGITEERSGEVTFLPWPKRLSLQKMSASDMTSLGTPALSNLHLTVRCKAMGKKVMSSGKLCLKMAISKEFL